MAGALLCLALGACNTMSESTFDSIKTRLNNDPDLKRRVINYCIDDFNHKRRADKEKAARSLGVPVSQAPAVGCRRIYGDLASGKLSYEVYKRAMEKK